MSETNSNIAILEKKETKVRFKKKYRVFIHNDGSTDFRIVELILKEVFKKSSEEAYSITMAIHKSGEGGKKVVAEYSSKNIADSKVTKAIKIARDFGFFEFKASADE